MFQEAIFPFEEIHLLLETNISTTTERRIFLLTVMPKVRKKSRIAKFLPSTDISFPRHRRTLFCVRRFFLFFRADPCSEFETAV